MREFYLRKQRVASVRIRGRRVGSLRLVGLSISCIRRRAEDRISCKVSFVDVEVLPFGWYLGLYVFGRLSQAENLVRYSPIIIRRIVRTDSPLASASRAESR